MPAGFVPSEAFENLLPSTCLASGRKKKKKGGSVSHSVVSNFFDPMDCSPPGSLLMEFYKKGYWSGLSFSSPGIFLTQGSNLALLLCRQTLYHMSYQRN